MLRIPREEGEPLSVANASKSQRPPETFYSVALSAVYSTFLFTIFTLELVDNLQEHAGWTSDGDECLRIALGQSFLQHDTNHLLAQTLAPIALVDTHSLDQENVTAVQLIAPDARTGSSRVFLENRLESPITIKEAEPHDRSFFICLTDIRVEVVSYLITSNQGAGARPYTIKFACLWHVAVVDIAVDYSLLVRQLRHWIAVDDGMYFEMRRGQCLPIILGSLICGGNLKLELVQISPAVVSVRLGHLQRWCILCGNAAQGTFSSRHFGSAVVKLWTQLSRNAILCILSEEGQGVVG